ncbi:MAG: hypothetical protein ABW044_04725, partial [Cellvibrio sp.]
MTKFLAGFFLVVVAQIAFAEGYGGVGVGASAACTNSQPGFSGGDCISPNMTIHGLVGNEFNEYFSIEGTVDFSFDAGNIADIILGRDDETSFFYDPTVDTNRWSILTLAVHPLVHIPLSYSSSFFAGPSLGGSMVDFDYDVKYFGNEYQSDRSTTTFGLNYGWTAGFDVNKTASGTIRLQWQNWRSLDADVAVNKE